MAEGYTDEELREQTIGNSNGRLVLALRRLMIERDEATRARNFVVRERNDAERVAQVLARKTKICNRDTCIQCTDEERDALRLANAYPTRPLPKEPGA